MKFSLVWRSVLGPEFVLTYLDNFEHDKKSADEKTDNKEYNVDG